MTHPFEPTEQDLAGLGSPLPQNTPKTSDLDADRQSPRQKPGFDKYAIVKWYWRGLWLIAFAMIYMVVVEYQIVGPIHSLLITNGQLTNNDVVVITPIRYPGQKFCEYITPQSVNLTTFMYAAYPWHWGSPLETYLAAHYCNMTYAQLNIQTYVTHTGGGPPIPNLTVPANSFVRINQT
jgi:hypothetical protein